MIITTIWSGNQVHCFVFKLLRLQIGLSKLCPHDNSVHNRLHLDCQTQSLLFWILKKTTQICRSSFETILGTWWSQSYCKLESSSSLHLTSYLFPPPFLLFLYQNMVFDVGGRREVNRAGLYVNLAYLDVGITFSVILFVAYHLCTLCGYAA